MTATTPTKTEPRSTLSRPVGLRKPSPISAAQWEEGILHLEDEYGVQLSIDIGRNVRITNGDVNQWLGEVWYYDGPTKISTNAINPNFETMLGILMHNVTQMLAQFGQVAVGSARRTA